MFMYRGVDSVPLSVIWSRILYVSAALIPFAFLFFIRVFPEEKYNLPEKYYYFLFIPFLAVVGISILPNILISNVFIPIGAEKIIFFNISYHTVYALYIIGYFSICYILLFIKYLKFEGIQKKQMLYVIVGTLVSTIIGVCTNLILPYLGYFALNWAGQVGIIVMISAISYSIVNHRLFSMKVVATQLAVFVLCLSLFVRLLISTNKTEIIINSIFLVITIIIGMFLIRSVLKEVKLREKIEALAKDLEQANIQQESLIHFITHQIKGFFAKSRDIYSMALEGDFGELPPALQPVMQEGLDSETKGVSLVKEILDSANLKKGTLTYTMEPFDFKKLVENIVAEQKRIAEIKELTVETHIADGDYTIVGDKDQLQHVIKNILDNSIKYTLHGGLKISLSETAEKVLFTVADTGVGITDEDRPQLFTAGGKGKNSIKVNVESTGFGLFIVKEIIERHKGKIWAESEGEGKGSTFFVELPKK
jgi:signal transduction histidine kinase